MKPLVHEAGVGSTSSCLRSDQNENSDNESGPDKSDGAGLDDSGRKIRLIEREQRANEMRSALFEGVKVRNGMWDMLLALMAAQRANRSLSMSDLCSMCDAPESTALRMIHQLRDEGYAEMVPDRADRRRTRVVLTDKTEVQFDAYFRRLERDDIGWHRRDGADFGRVQGERREPC